MSKRRFTESAEPSVNEFTEDVIDEIVDDVEQEIEPNPEVVEPEAVVASAPEIVAVKGVVSGCSALNVRSKPASNAEVLSTIPCATEVIVDETESTDDFYKIYTAAGVEGFCMKKYITVPVKE